MMDCNKSAVIFEVILKAILFAVLFSLTAPAMVMQKNERPRARDVGLRIGVLPTGPLNAITDVAGVTVGQTTVSRVITSARGSLRFCRTAATSFAKRFRARSS